MKYIDIHTHGIGDFDTKTESPDDILKIAELHGKDGVTEILPTVYSSGIDTMRKHMAAIRAAMEQQQSEPNGSSRIKGIHLEGPFLNPTNCGALNARSFLHPSEYNLNELIEGYEDIVKIMTISPELEGAIEVIALLARKGICVSMGHTDATHAEAEAGFRAGARSITHIFNAMRGIHHREPGAAGFGLANKDVYVEVIADPFHLDPAILQLIFTAKNPDRIIIISDTIKAAKTDAAANGIRNRKNTLLGGCMTIRESSDRLIELGFSKELIGRTVSENPEHFLQHN